MNCVSSQIEARNRLRRFTISSSEICSQGKKKRRKSPEAFFCSWPSQEKCLSGTRENSVGSDREANKITQDF